MISFCCPRRRCAGSNRIFRVSHGIARVDERRQISGSSSLSGTSALARCAASVRPAQATPIGSCAGADSACPTDFAELPRQPTNPPDDDRATHLTAHRSAASHLKKGLSSTYLAHQPRPELEAARRCMTRQTDQALSEISPDQCKTRFLITLHVAKLRRLKRHHMLDLSHSSARMLLHISTPSCRSEGTGRTCLVSSTKSSADAAVAPMPATKSRALSSRFYCLLSYTVARGLTWRPANRLQRLHLLMEARPAQASQRFRRL